MSILLAPSSSTAAQERFLSQLFEELHRRKMVYLTSYALVVILGVWVTYQSYNIISQHIFNEKQSHDHLGVCRRVPVSLTLTWCTKRRTRLQYQTGILVWHAPYTTPFTDHVVFRAKWSALDIVCNLVQRQLFWESTVHYCQSVWEWNASLHCKLTFISYCKLFT